VIIDLARFVERERPVWEELEHRLDRLEQGPGMPLDLEGVKRLHYLYERTSADLARLSTFASERALQQYLEHLVARAYGEIHEVRREGLRFRPLRWFLRTFPRTWRAHSGCFLLALGITLAGSLFGGVALLLDPAAKPALMPFPHLQGDPSERVAWEEGAHSDRLEGAKLTFSSTLMTHNTRISMLTLALGMTYGIGTLVLLFYNGAILGAVAADYLRAGEGVFLSGWLLPHGSTEIPAILIAGQAGFVLALALLRKQKREPVKARLRAVLPDLGTLIGGVAVLLVWAGIVESFLSQYHEPQLPYALKIGFGRGVLVVLFLFLTRAGRGPAGPEGGSA